MRDYDEWIEGRETATKCRSFRRDYNEWIAGRGRPKNAQNGQLKSEVDIAEAVGETRQTTQRLLKLNNLIPELQQLVSKGKLGTTAAEQLAYLTEDEQRALFDALGETVANTTVAEAGELKQEARRVRIAWLMSKYVKMAH